MAFRGGGVVGPANRLCISFVRDAKFELLLDLNNLTSVIILQ